MCEPDMLSANMILSFATQMFNGIIKSSFLFVLWSLYVIYFLVCIPY